MQIKTFLAHGDVEGMEAEINLFLMTLSSDPIFTSATIDEHRIFVMIGYDAPKPAATTEPVGAADQTSAAPPTTPPPAAPTDAPATSA